MNKSHTEIVFLLDRSGSMESMVEPAISGFNRLLREQQQVPGHARFTLVLFDDQYEVPFQSVPISEVVSWTPPPLSHAAAPPCSMPSAG